MPRNKSEKVPRVLAQREVSPAYCEPSLLMLKVEADGAHSVSIVASPYVSHVMETSDGAAARRVYDWFQDNFFYNDIPGWGSSLWRKVS